MTKRPVSFSALFRRCKRRLYSKHSLYLHKARPPWTPELGDFYMVNYNGYGAGWHVNSIEELARELGVMAEDEELVE